LLEGRRSNGKGVIGETAGGQEWRAVLLAALAKVEYPVVHRLLIAHPAVLIRAAKGWNGRESGSLYGMDNGQWGWPELMIC